MKTLKEAQAIARKSGVTVDDIVAEMEAGFDPSKPFSVVVTYQRLDDLRRFAKQLEQAGLGIYQGDGLDKEFSGAPRKNSFVVRGLEQQTGKPESWRII